MSARRLTAHPQLATATKVGEMSVARMMAAIAEADVVITNPEHFAVCLVYDPSSDDPPKMVAKCGPCCDASKISLKERAGILNRLFWQEHFTLRRRLARSFQSRCMRLLQR